MMTIFIAKSFSALYALLCLHFNLAPLSALWVARVSSPKKLFLREKSTKKIMTNLNTQHCQVVWKSERKKVASSAEFFVIFKNSMNLLLFMSSSVLALQAVFENFPFIIIFASRESFEANIWRF